MTDQTQPDLGREGERPSPKALAEMLAVGVDSNPSLKKYETILDNRALYGESSVSNMQLMEAVRGLVDLQKSDKIEDRLLSSSLVKRALTLSPEITNVAFMESYDRNDALNLANIYASSPDILFDAVGTDYFTVFTGHLAQLAKDDTIGEREVRLALQELDRVNVGTQMRRKRGKR